MPAMVGYLNHWATAAPGSGATRKTTRREDRSANTCGPHSDSFNDTSRRRRCLFHKQFPVSLQKQILNPSALSVHSL
ncbi:hypothetical protein TNCV_1508151 [Trichonephila clavipes]|nr:hypothetical protein TNCV_1508151 [Trichonephila clavipes]